jgi:hypothetical protein
VPDESLPDGAYEAADAAFEHWMMSEECAGPEGTQRIPGRDELEAALLAAAPLIAAAERERIRQLAERNNAVCAGDEGTQCWFSDLLGEMPS